MFKISDKESISVMSVLEFCAITDNPRQRDTARHAKSAQLYHLKEAAEVHKYVVVAVLPNGEMIKLDGHTRAHLWVMGKLEAPTFVVALLRSARNVKHAMEMYMEYDNVRAAETAADRMTAAMKNANFQSKLLRSGKYISTLALAKNGNIDPKATEGEGIYNLFDYFQEDLLKLDAINPTGNKFVSGVLAAALLTLQKHGDEVLTFWDLYNRDMGEKSGKEKDAIQTLADHIQVRRIQKTLSSRAHVVDICGKSIAACERWLKGEKYASSIKGLDVPAYVKSIKKEAVRKPYGEPITQKNTEKYTPPPKLAKFPANPMRPR